MTTKELVRRFSVRQIVEHWSVMSIFTVLALTGFPQKFNDTTWAAWIVSTLGGIENVRTIHRVAGILFAAFTVVHILTAVTMFVSGRSELSMVPKRQDFKDAIITLRYYLGLSDKTARFDRYDYRQKFEYWGLVLGGALMIFTGFVLYFPSLTSHLLPAQIIPAAKVAHSQEGLMAFLVVIVWHIYNAHLNPDVFPFDRAMFNGKISRERLAHEHPLEYERVFGEPAPSHGHGHDHKDAESAESAVSAESAASAAPAATAEEPPPKTDEAKAEPVEPAAKPEPDPDKRETPATG